VHVKGAELEGREGSAAVAVDRDAADLVRLERCAHNKYAINKRLGVQDSIIPNITASMVVTEISSVDPRT
jgi:hypothetical protein